LFKMHRKNILLRLWWDWRS